MSQILYDYFPILCFVLAYKFWGIYVATAVLMATTIIQVLYMWIRHRRVDKQYWIVLIIILILGGLTLIVHKTIFIKWKPSVIYWIFGILLIGSQYIGDKKPLLKRMLGKQITLKDKPWLVLNITWAVFFIAMGFINLYVAYEYNTSTWVYFKLFGTLGATILMVVIQAFYIYKHLPPEQKHKK